LKAGTSGAVTGDVDIADAGVGIRESGEFRDEWLRNDFGVNFITLCIACSLDVSLPESGTRSHIINVFLDMGRHVIGLS
jgi:hypothetical protein